jgi:raffinose/stachyose/melibiose transport system substrate-binding protein
MKKGLSLALVFVLVMVCSLSTIFAEDTVTLKVLNYMDLSSPGAQTEINQIWGDFEKANPNIKIEREDLFNEPFHQKTEAYAAAGKLPDVIYMWPGGRSTTLHTRHLVKDLRPFLGKDAKNFSAAALVPQAGGYLGEIPIGVTATHALYVNKKMLADLGIALPKTYAQLVAAAKQLKAAGKGAILMGAQDDWVMQSCLFSMIVGRICGDDYVAGLKAGKIKFTDAQFVKALKFYAGLYRDGVLDKKNLQTAYNDVNGLWASGRAPFMVDGDWKVGNFLTDPTTKQALIPVAEQANYAMTIFPRIPGEKNHQTTSVVPGVGFGMNAKIPAGSAREKAAWKLISWLVSPEVQKIRLETGAAFPSRKGVTSDKLEPLAQERARFYGAFKGTCVLDNELDAKVYAPINTGLQEIGLGVATPEQVAANVQKAYERWKAGQN